MKIFFIREYVYAFVGPVLIKAILQVDSAVRCNFDNHKVAGLHTMTKQSCKWPNTC